MTNKTLLILGLDEDYNVSQVEKARKALEAALPKDHTGVVYHPGRILSRAKVNLLARLAVSAASGLLKYSIAHEAAQGVRGRLNQGILYMNPWYTKYRDAVDLEVRDLILQGGFDHVIGYSQGSVVALRALTSLTLEAPPALTTVGSPLWSNTVCHLAGLDASKPVETCWWQNYYSWTDPISPMPIRALRPDIQFRLPRATHRLEDYLGGVTYAKGRA
jgi:hypothetical protein